ncbi:MAG: DUF1922 domain-containing protein [Candidatus Helarchaeota archaeon]|nr:DUF1922 domain-containing protein [Candidatus Helarchaeota archaeon]
MTTYKIFHCPRCETLLYCPYIQKTKKCPKCQKKIVIRRMKILKVTNSLKDTIFLIQNLKLPPEIRQKITDSTKNSFILKGKKEKFLDLIRKIQRNSLNQIILENDFIKEAEQAGFSEEWVSIQLAELEKNGLLVHPTKGQLQFII